MPLRGTIVALLWAVAIAAGAVLPSTGAYACGAADQADRKRAGEEVMRAEKAVQEAARQRALWTTAREALEQARAALARGDYSAAAKAARFAQEQARLGIAQRGYRHFE